MEAKRRTARKLLKFLKEETQRARKTFSSRHAFICCDISANFYGLQSAKKLAGRFQAWVSIPGSSLLSFKDHLHKQKPETRKITKGGRAFYTS